MAKKDEPKKIKDPFSTNLDHDLLKELRIYCAIHEKNQNEVIEELLTELFIKDKKEGGGIGNTDK